MPPPAEFVIAKFGGQSALARLLGKGQSTVQHWAKSGRIPAQWQAKLLELARERGVALTPADFIGPSESGHSHSVQFYNDDAFLVESVARFVADSLSAGGAAVVIATQAHRKKLAEALRVRGFDVGALSRSGRYVALDAVATLKLFMRSGQPERKRFFSAIVKVVERARRAGKGRRASEGKKPALFGEMVAVLWRQGERQAAIALEKLWNDLAAEREFSLLCAYPMNGFLRHDLGQPFAEVCNQHADVIPAETYSAETYSGVADDNARRRAVAGLQQRVQAMDGEIRRSRERLGFLQEVAGLGSWEMDLVDDSIELSPEAQQMIGFQTAGRIALDEFLERIASAGDRESFLAGLNRARTGLREFKVRFRVKVKEGSRLLHGQGKTIYNSGEPVIVGVMQEMTAPFQLRD